MRRSTLYDLLAHVYGRVVDPLESNAVLRTVHRVRAGDPRSILEVGVGPGRILQELGERGSKHVVGVDISSGMLSSARRATAALAHAPRLVRADVLRLPFHDGSFEAVVTTFLLDLLHDDELPVALNEMTRVTSPGGRVIVGVFEPQQPLIEQAWNITHRVLPDLVGQCRPLKLNGLLPTPGLRVVTEDSVKGKLGMKLVTMVKVG